MSQVTITIPAAGVSAPVDLTGKKLVGAVMLPLSGTWPPNSPSGPLPAALMVEVLADAAAPTWEPLRGSPNVAGSSPPAFLFGAGNLDIGYVTFPDVYRDLTDTVRFSMQNAFPADVTVVLVVKEQCSISVVGC